MPGRKYDGGEYRYGFQGQETDKEWLGGAVSYKYRVHDARIGRFLSVDPLAPDYPHNSPYAFSENRVIDGVELEGLEFLSQCAIIELRNDGEIHLKLEDFSDSYQRAWATRDETLTNNGATVTINGEQHLGAYPTEIGSISHTSINHVETPELFDNDIINDWSKNISNSPQNFTKNWKRDRRFTSTHTMTTAVSSARGLLILEIGNLAVNAINSVVSAYEADDIHADTQRANADIAAANRGVAAMNSYFGANEFDTSLAQGDNLLKLTNYVVFGVKEEGYDDIYILGDAVLNTANAKKPIINEE